MNKYAVYIMWDGTKGRDAFTRMAMSVEYKDGKLIFFDTDRDHMFEGQVSNDTPDGFIFKPGAGQYGEGQTWKFTILTIEAFKQRYQKYVEGGAGILRAVNTTADLHEWYRRKFR